MGNVYLHDKCMFVCRMLLACDVSQIYWSTSQVGYLSTVNSRTKNNVDFRSHRFKGGEIWYAWKWKLAVSMLKILTEAAHQY